MIDTHRCSDILVDIESFFNYLIDDPNWSNLRPDQEDELGNFMIGILSIYGRRFERTFECE